MMEEKDYKNTLNLPKTSFSMKANLANKEPMRLNSWKKNNIYKNILKSREGREKFILHDGPPYANGNIHIGHAVNKILKDIIIKSKTMSGYYAPYVPGWDCHGLPIELQVEKLIGKPNQKYSEDRFRKECRKYAKKQINNQKKDFVRLGIFGDWDNPYLSMDFSYEANMIRNLGKIIKNNHLLKGFKPVHWCTECGSALAEAEVEYKNKISPAIDVLFKVKNNEKWQKAFNIDYLGLDTFVVIWTTTPWTIPANKAICFNNDIEYSLVRFGEKDINVIIAKDLVNSVVNRCNIKDFEILQTIKGEKLEGLETFHPFYDRESNLFHGDHVSSESGTGLVHTAPSHGLEDFAIGNKYNLDLTNIVDNNGYFFDSLEFFGGEFIFSANKSIISKLLENNRLLNNAKLDHSYAHCWRHKTPLIYSATPQWFISMEQNNLRDKAKNAITEVKWIPSWGQARIEKMMEDRPDWCISRQRIWGVPIPLFVHKETSKLHPNTFEIIEKVANKVEKAGIESWFNADSTEFIEDVENYNRVNDTLDVWFDSGSTNFCVLENRKDLSFPADLYLEGSDQHRGWFQTSLLVSLARLDKKPYKQVLTHGFAVDANGRKMSKSLGNVIAPDEVLKTLGADTLRLWVSSTDYRSEMTVSKEILKRTSDKYRRIRNTARFLLSNLQGFNPEKDLIQFDKMTAIDKWAVARTHQVQKAIKSSYEAYQFHIVTQNIHHFCSIDMGSFYLDIIKDRQYTAGKNSLARKSTQSAMYHIIQALVRWLAPILPFTADEISASIPNFGDESIFIKEWYDNLRGFDVDEELNFVFWQKILTVKDEINRILEKIRISGQIGSSLEAEVILYVDSEWYKILTKIEPELRFVFITSKVVLKHRAEAHHLPTVTKIDGINLDINKSKSKKCNRCWHRRDDVGLDSNHPDLCQRCITNIETGHGEVRLYA